MNRTFDRVVKFDERSRNYPIRTILPTDKWRSRHWWCHKRLDQGMEGACVGFAMAHELNARPKIVTKIENHHAFKIYEEAKKIDEWAGENYEGTSVLAGIKVLKRYGFIDEYRWAFGIDDVINTLGNFGPIVAGTWWYEGMWDTDTAGFVTPAGKIVGGHAYLVRGVNLNKGFVTIRNSWGKSWGVDGDCKIRIDDFAMLLKKEGEACVPVVRKTAKISQLI